jgi:hypothetical protein
VNGAGAGDGVQNAAAVAREDHGIDAAGPDGTYRARLAEHGLGSVDEVPVADVG